MISDKWVPFNDPPVFGLFFKKSLVAVSDDWLWSTHKIHNVDLEERICKKLRTQKSYEWALRVYCVAGQDAISRGIGGRIGTLSIHASSKALKKLTERETMAPLKIEQTCEVENLGTQKGLKPS